MNQVTYFDIKLGKLNIRSKHLVLRPGARKNLSVFELHTTKNF